MNPVLRIITGPYDTVVTGSCVEYPSMNPALRLITGPYGTVVTRS